MKRRDILLSGLAAGAATGAAHAQAQAQAQADFPNKPLKFVVPQPPGGGFDFVGRTLADHMGKGLGQSVVVENRPGSGTLVGTDAVAKAAPDGYTLLVGSVSNMVLNVGLYPSLPYDPVRDFEPVGNAVAYSYTLMARKDLAVASLADLIAKAKAQPRGFSYASAGNGSGQHVIAAALWHQAGVELLHVPYRGAQAAYQDLLGGRVDVFFDLAPTEAARRTRACRRFARGEGHLHQGRWPPAAPECRRIARHAPARPGALDPAHSRRRLEGRLTKAEPPN